MAEIVDNDSRIVKVQSNQGDVFDVTRKAIEMCKVLDDYCASSGFDDNPDMELEPLPAEHVNSKTLQLVIQWCEYHCRLPAGEQNATREVPESDEHPQNSAITEWGKELLNVDKGTLFDLTMAANYLNCESLLDATCKTIASLLDGLTPTQIQQQFNVKNDFSEEEKREIALGEGLWLLHPNQSTHS